MGIFYFPLRVVSLPKDFSGRIQGNTECELKMSRLYTTGYPTGDRCIPPDKFKFRQL